MITLPTAWKSLLSIAGFALLLRVLVFVIASQRGHISIERYVSKGDTASYIANAAAMCGDVSWNNLDVYHWRVFPGYPAMIAIVHSLGVPLAWAALIVTWISAATAAMLAAMVFEDLRVGWAMTCLIPHYLINSSLGMSEAPLLAMVCAGMLACRKDRMILAGAAFAFAGMIRPPACFAVAGAALMLMQKRDWRQLMMLTGATTMFFLTAALAYHLWTGDALRGIHVYASHPGAYDGHLFGWPFQSLLNTPARDHASIGRIIYIWVHVILTMIGCVLCVVQARSGRTVDVISMPWLIGNTIFVLCIGSVWGFRHFPRFTIPAAPAMFWACRTIFPKHAGCWFLIAIPIVVMAVGGVIESP